jgi:Protein kinase domain
MEVPLTEDSRVAEASQETQLSSNRLDVKESGNLQPLQPRTQPSSSTANNSAHIIGYAQSMHQLAQPSKHSSVTISDQPKTAAVKVSTTSLRDQKMSTSISQVRVHVDSSVRDSRTKIYLYPRRSIISNSSAQNIYEDGIIRASIANSRRGYSPSVSHAVIHEVKRESNLSAHSFGAEKRPILPNQKSYNSKTSSVAENAGESVADMPRYSYNSNTGKRPVSILSMKQAQQLKNVKSIEKTAEATPLIEEMSLEERSKLEYLEYLELSQRHDSTNFIHILDSSEGLWERKAISLKVIGTFLLGDKIGKGAFGKVKEGVCTETLQRVAVKIMSKQRVKKAQNGVEGVVREIKLLRKLKHPNIIGLVNAYAKVEDKEGNNCVFPWFLTIEEEPVIWLYEDGTEEEKSVKLNKWYLVLEFCPCSLQTLLDKSDDKKLPVEEAHRYPLSNFRYFVQLMEGLSYLHSQSVIRNYY